jgi:cytidylate kinase
VSKNISIAIDGPSGAGKSTISKKLSADLGILYLDTGALYRAIGLYVQRAGINSKDAEKIAEALKDIKIELAYVKGEQRIFLCGIDVTKDIRMPEISIYASDVSAIPQVRAFLLDLQRDTAKHNSVIMDGRDIGTVVLPDAQIKIFLTASPEDRAKRRYEELIKKGIKTTFEEVLGDILYRDSNDSSRAVAPLKPAGDAVILDTTGNSFNQSYELVKKFVIERMQQ